MGRLRPEPPVQIALLVACALPLAALAVWFGLVDSPGIGEGRCDSCGVEGYVIAAHVAAAGWLALVVAAASTVRRVATGLAGPGTATLCTLGLVFVFIAVALFWHQIFRVPGTIAVLASLVLYPVAVVWWVYAVLRWWRRPPTQPDALRGGVTNTLLLSWVCLLVLLPATFGWVWLDRVDWVVF